MTQKSFYTIAIKLFGLFFIKEAVMLMPQILYTLIHYFNSINNESYKYNAGNSAYLLIVVLSLVIYVAIALLSIFKTDKIVNTLNLVQEEDQGVSSMTISEILIFNIVLFILSGTILVSEIPNLCKSVFNFLQVKDLSRGFTKPDYSFIILSAVKLLIGLMMIAARNSIQKLFKIEDDKS